MGPAPEWNVRKQNDGIGNSENGDARVRVRYPYRHSPPEKRFRRAVRAGLGLPALGLSRTTPVATGAESTTVEPSDGHRSTDGRSAE
jgi:hypothetical protein